MNIDFLFQLINRVTRLGVRKKFVKICEKSMFEYQYTSLNAACALIIREYYETYTVDNIKNLKLSISKSSLEAIRNKNKVTIPKILFNIDLDFLVRNYNDKQIYAKTSIKDIKSLYTRTLRKINAYDILQNMEKCQSKQEFIKKYPNDYKYILGKKNLKEKFDLLFPNTKMTLEKAIKIAEKHNSLNSLRNANINAYKCLFKYDKKMLYKMCPPKILISDKKTGIAERLKIAKEYKSRADLYNNNEKVFTYLYKHARKQLDKLHPITHITRSHLLNEKSVKKAIKACTTAAEFRKKFRPEYEYAIKHNISRESLYKEKMNLKIAKQFLNKSKTRTEFAAKHRAAYDYLKENYCHVLDKKFPKLR